MARTALVFIVVFAAALAVAATSARAGVLYLDSCSHLGDESFDVAVNGPVWAGYGSGAYGLPDRCPQGGSFQIISEKLPGKKQSAQWLTVAPPNIEIVHAFTPKNDVLLDPDIKSDGYAASFVWQGSSETITPENKCCGGMDYGAGINRAFDPSTSFAFRVTCQGPPIPCKVPRGQLLDVNGIQLEATESTGPTLNPSGLWAARGAWVRGIWPIQLDATDNSGICAMGIYADGLRVNSVSESPDTHSWTQCGAAAQSLAGTVNTAAFDSGAPLALSVFASNAACTVAASPCTSGYMTTPASETVNVDNEPVGLTMSGLTDAPSTAGAQDITATATAGPSGVAGIECSANGGPYRFTSGRIDRVLVAGIGEHTVSCYALNNAVDPDGTRGRSAVESWTMSIREPSVSTVSFARVVDGLHCVPMLKRIRVPAQWVTVRSHGHRVRVRVPAQTRTIKVVHCHARVVTRRVKTAGHWRTERAVVLPRTVHVTTKQIAFGHATKVSGWIGTFQGNALAHQPVDVYTTPADGRGGLTIAARVQTAANGSWTATLRAGPSRIVRAVYPGSATVEPSSSEAARLVVPASVTLGVSPSSTRWGGTISINGRARGGYVPASGELIVLWIGWAGGSTEIGHIYTGAKGAFHTTYTFLRGNGTETYHLWASTARESDYPFAPSSSRRVVITVGP